MNSHFSNRPGDTRSFGIHSHSKAQRGALAQAFTLVELLVVITIISLLVAMLLPALGKSRAVTRDMMCQSNLRQIYLAFTIYLNEDGDYGPAMINWFDSLGAAHTLGEPKLHGPNITAGTYNFALYRYPGLNCPAENPEVLVTGDPSYNGRPTTNYDNEFMRVSYMYNWSINQYNYWSPRRHWSDPKATKPDMATMLMDGRIWSYGWDIAYFEWNVDYAYWPHAFTTHPNDKANVMYMDGHITHEGHYSKTGKSLFTWNWAYGE